MRRPDGGMASAVKDEAGKNAKDGNFSFSATGRRIKAVREDFVTALHFGIRSSHSLFNKIIFINNNFYDRQTKKSD